MLRPILQSLSFVALATLMCGGAGCSSNRKPPAATQPGGVAVAPATQPKRASGKPLLDFSKGAGGFPLEGERLPTSREGLVDSLTKAYLDRVDLPPGTGAPVIAFGTGYPSLDALIIDLSDARVRDEKRVRPKKGDNSLETAVLRTKYLQYFASPLLYADGKTHLRIVAHDVDLGLLRGKDDGAALVMTGASEGRVHFAVGVEDLRTMFLTSAKAGAGRVGFIANDLKLELKSGDSHSLACNVVVKGFWLLLPAGFRISGEAVVDEAFNIQFKNLRASGLDIGGGLIAGFLNNAMKKYDGQLSPIARFPGDRIQFRDLKISVDDSLRIDIAFANHQ